MKIVCISDVHGKWNKIHIEECDLLISAGDYSWTGELHMVREFHKWLKKQPARRIISLNGNHEKQVEKNFALSKQMAETACPGVHFIDEGLVEVEGLKIWCSAITPFFHNWAWNRYPGDEIQYHWDKIPNDADVIITHGPCHGILDEVMNFNGQKCEWEKINVGCPQLLKRVLEIKPKVHFCGHIHGGHGCIQRDGIWFINASICDEQYKPTNKPIIFSI